MEDTRIRRIVFTTYFNNQIRSACKEVNNKPFPNVLVLMRAQETINKIKELHPDRNIIVVGNVEQ